MHLVRVFSNDRKFKVFVKVSKLADLIDEGRKKLKLPDVSYEVHQEDDGTLIDDDAVFETLCEEASSSKQKLCVMLISEDSTWLAVNSECGPSPSRRSTSESSGTSDSSSLDSVPNSSNSSRGFPISSVTQFLDPLIEILNNSTHPPKHFPHMRKHAIKETFHAIGNHMILTLKDFSKPTARNLAQAVLDYEDKKYSRIFAIDIGDVACDSGLGSFAQQIYAYVQANKGEDNKHQKRSRKRVHGDGEEDPDGDLHPPPPSKQDCYGCVAFDPPLPEGENANSQEVKRVAAVTMDPLSEEATDLMKKTYASQRTEINRGKPMLTNLPKILDRWPLLKCRVILIAHAAILLGKDVSSVWTNAVSVKWECVFKFLKFYWQNPKKSNEEMLNLMQNAEELDMAGRSVVSRCASIFLLITRFMSEKSSALLSTVHALSSDEDVLKAAAGAEGYPLIVVKGDSLIDPDAEYFVVLVGNTAVKASDATEAVLLLLLCYYNFNLCYHPKLQSTLEFFQRCFLDVNPPPEKGNKRSKQRRTVDHVDAKVKSLGSKLKDHSSLWILPAH